MCLYHVIDKKALNFVSSVLVSQLKFCMFFSFMSTLWRIHFILLDFVIQVTYNNKYTITWCCSLHVSLTWYYYDLFVRSEYSRTSQLGVLKLRSKCCVVFCFVSFWERWVNPRTIIRTTLPTEAFAHEVWQNICVFIL